MRYLLPLLLIACGPPTPRTAADGCFNVAVSFCHNSNACGTLSGTVAECRSRFVEGCCAGVNCARTLSPAEVDYFYECTIATQDSTCGQIAAGLVPKAC